MTATTIAIPVAFVLLAGILCWLIIGVKGKWAFKLPAILFVPAFGLAVWGAIASYQGWPTKEPLPDKIRLLWSEVREPYPATGDPGAIFVWGIPLVGTDEPGVLEYQHDDREPRAYQLTYSRPLHEVLHGAQEKLKAGEPVLLQRERERGTERERGGRSGHEPEFKAHDLPPAPVPRKNE